MIKPFSKSGNIALTESTLIIALFIISRILVHYAGVTMDYQALYRNWQYLSIPTLEHNLLNGVWYDHTQPPLFNLFLGSILKLSGKNAPLVFAGILKLITLINAFLLLHIAKKTISHKYIPIILSCIYLLSPATILFENELFYTSFISLLLLISCFFLIQFKESLKKTSILGFFFALVLVCLTRSMYHLIWLLGAGASIYLLYRNREGARTLLTVSLISAFVVGSWYIKNYTVFRKFTASTWSGMNIARNVFHDHIITDSSRIEAIEPFSEIQAYNNFIDTVIDGKFIGVNDADLLLGKKNDSFLNLKHIKYIEVSDKYMQASKQQIRKYPFSYAKNVLQSSIIFFAPASRYPINEIQARKIKYYDLLYSFNLSHFAEGKQERRIALSLSALPKILAYFFVFLFFFRQILQKRKVLAVHFYILYVIVYIFGISSLFEHYENMRFRYEAEPLFLLLFGYTLASFRRFTSQKINS